MRVPERLAAVSPKRWLAVVLSLGITVLGYADWLVSRLANIEWVWNRLWPEQNPGQAPGVKTWDWLTLLSRAWGWLTTPSGRTVLMLVGLAGIAAALFWPDRKGRSRGLFWDVILGPEVAPVEFGEPEIVGSRVYLPVTNVGKVVAEFIAQVEKIEGADPKPTGHWYIKWDGTTDDRRQLYPGVPCLLELVEVDARGTFDQVGGGRPGRFYFVGPKARKEVWLSMTTARPLGLKFLYEAELTVTARVVSLPTRRARSAIYQLGVNQDLSPRISGVL